MEFFAQDKNEHFELKNPILQNSDFSEEIDLIQPSVESPEVSKNDLGTLMVILPFFIHLSTISYGT